MIPVPVAIARSRRTRPDSRLPAVMASHVSSKTRARVVQER